jgi:hypothetical protein
VKGDVQKETEETPAIDIHLGEIRSIWTERRYRHCIIWLNGKRWEGTLIEAKNG